MSKSKKSQNVLTDEQQLIHESFTEAMMRGEVTDILGEPMGMDELVEVDPAWSKEEFVTNVVLGQYKTLMGKVLTIVDASYEKERAKYIKDLVKDAFSSQASHLMEML